MDFLNVLKRLPLKDGSETEYQRYFYSDTKRYCILRMDELNGKRLGEMQRMSIPFAMNMTFAKLIEELRQIQRQVYDIDPKDTITKTYPLASLLNIEKAILETGNAKNHIIFTFCSIFIIEVDERGKPTEDIKEWNYEEQEDKINDFETNFLGYDFFFLAAQNTTNFALIYRQALDNLSKLTPDNMTLDIIKLAMQGA